MAGTVDVWLFPASALARGALRAILASYDPQRRDARALTLRHGEFGKPYLEERFVRFNMTHSGDRACVAVSAEAEVGVDLEAHDAALDLAPLVARFFSRAERAAFAALPRAQRRRAFFDGWTRREAVFKALGLGLGIDPDAFDVALEPNAPRVVAVRDERFVNPCRTLLALDAGPGFSAALCVETECGGVRRRALAEAGIATSST
ncbi:MAG: 4'-phosphopantetheinyl transferase superfamily protein [Candidatus Eremiobacteraeota bacterium]|nr:4'-phosphopantetheinyl transferase superfamily protein [Candidatus Eremiobacteraeota bacterium]